MKWTMATIRSAIDHQENAKKRNDPIAKSHYSMAAKRLVVQFRDHQGKPKCCVHRNRYESKLIVPSTVTKIVLNIVLKIKDIVLRAIDCCLRTPPRPGDTHA